jgi:transcriptional regulator with XRE-family HTH domain
MSTNWPAYLKAAMDAAGVQSAAELSRRTGIGEAQISRWLRGQNQTEMPMLRRLSPVLKVPVLELAVAAGHIEPAEARMKDVPSPPPVPVGAGVDPDVLADLATASPEVIEAVRALIRATKG